MTKGIRPTLREFELKLNLKKLEAELSELRHGVYSVIIEDPNTDKLGMDNASVLAHLQDWFNITDVHITQAEELEAKLSKCQQQKDKLEEALRWIPIKELLPDKSGYYLVCWVYDSSIVSGEVWYEQGLWIYPHYGGDEKENSPELPVITHWMKIPLPPIAALDALEDDGLPE